MREYIIRKFVMADTAEEAIRKSKRASIREAYVNPDWKEPEKPIEGFNDKKTELNISKTKKVKTE